LEVEIYANELRDIKWCVDIVPSRRSPSLLIYIANHN
jgi:hypothetical protein